MKGKNDEWFIKLYSYLNRYDKLEQRIELMKLKIIRLESDNELASILDGPIFFPLDKKGNYGFEKDLRILKRTIFEPKEIKKKRSVIEFLKKINVQDALPYEIIQEHILSVYENNDNLKNWKSGKPLIGYVRYIKDHLVDYKKESDKRLNARKMQREIKGEPLRRLRNSLYIQINKTVDGLNYYRHPEDIYLPKTYTLDDNLDTLFEGIIDIGFVSQEYIKDIIKKHQLARKDKKYKANQKKKEESEISEWRDFFIELGVNKIPRVITREEIRTHTTNSGNEHKQKVTIHQSPDICKILKIKNADKNKRLLRILDQNWDHYRDFKVWTNCSFSYNWNYYTYQSDWFEKIRTENWLPVSQNINYLGKPNEIFLKKPEIKALLGDSVLYLDADLKNQEFIKDLGINSEATTEGILNNLKSIVDKKCLDKATFIKFYSFLSANYERNENTIKTAFMKNEIVLIPDNQKYYFTIQDVLWGDASKIFGENRGYLGRHYPKLKSFFVEKLGVAEKPAPKDYTDFLIGLSQKDVKDKGDEGIVIEIYRELNSHLNPENNDYLISEEEWWSDFKKGTIFRTENGDFCKNDNDVFVNDKQELYEMFKDKPQVTFLKLPRNFFPQIRYFIEAVGISYLSKAIDINSNEIENPKNEADLTEQIRRFFPYILRYLYQSDHEIYEKVKKSGRLTHLNNLKCYSVDGLRVEYILNHQIQLSQRKTFLDEHQWILYIQKDSLEDIDQLAISISESSVFFEKLKGFDSFLISLFNKKTDDNIKKLLKTMGIQELPDGEMEELEVKETSTEDTLQQEPESQDTEEIQKIKHAKDGEIELSFESESKGKGKIPEPEVESTSESISQEKEEILEIETTTDLQKKRADRSEIDWKLEKEFQEKREPLKNETRRISQVDTTQGSDEKLQPESRPHEDMKKSEFDSQVNSKRDISIVSETEWSPECDPIYAEIHIEEFQARENKLHKTPDITGNSDDFRLTSSNVEEENPETLSQNAKKAIGRWGEEYALICLKKKLCTKYPEGILEEKEGSFNISLNGQLIVEVHWLNKIKDEGKGHDIKVIENGKEGYLEVKSTKTDTKDWFELSRKQWELAKEKGGNFHIYRIYNAGTEQAKLVDISDPDKLWQEGNLIAYPIRIKI